MMSIQLKMRDKGAKKSGAGSCAQEPAPIFFVPDAYFFAGAAAAPPLPLKYLKKSELESITITSL
jgi:hypothetical protein